MLRQTLAAASALLLTLVTLTLVALTLVALLGTLTHADAVGYLDGIDGEKLTRPLPGQLYIVSPEGRIEQQLCQIEELEFEIDHLSGWTFVNRLGETVPAVFRIAPHISSLNRRANRTSASAIAWNGTASSRNSLPRTTSSW